MSTQVSKFKASRYIEINTIAATLLSAAPTIEVGCFCSDEEVQETGPKIRPLVIPGGSEEHNLDSGEFRVVRSCAMSTNCAEDSESASMSNRPNDLLAILALEPIEVNLFRGSSPKTAGQQVFGGQVIGQAMVAACRTVESWLPHSLHAYFLLPGDPKIPIIYQVERLRDGRSYSTRRVTAVQRGNAIFSIIVSFHAEEQGTFDHQDKMPEMPSPEKVAAGELSNRAIFPETPEFIRDYYAIELRPVEIGRYFGQKIDDGRVHVWIKISANLPDNSALHRCALAYASDISLLDVVMARHGRTLFDERLRRTSLDHAMWFHRPFPVDDWLLYARDSPSAQGGRGLTRGLIFKRDGKLVASVVQEGSVRERR